jgi:MFS family permease
LSLKRPEAASAKRKEGGIFYGWWVLGSGVLTYFAYAEQFNTSYGVFIQQLTQEMGWSRTALAGVNTASRLPEALFTTLLGPFVDRHGARWLVAVGGLLVGGSFMALSTMEHLWQLYLYKAVLMAIGAVCLGGFVGVTVSNWFVAKRGRAIGIIHMGGFLATGIMPLAGAAMIEQWGWRTAWFAMGVLVIVLSVPAVVLFRRRPEDLGLHPDGIAPEDRQRQSVSASERQRRDELLAADVTWTTARLLRTPVLWIAVFAWGLSSLAVTGTNLHIVPYMQELGYPLILAAAALSLRAGSALVGAPIWGVVAERYRVNLVASVQFVFKGAAMLVFLFWPTPIGLGLGLIVYGIGVAGSQVVLEVLLANYFGRTSLGRVRSVATPVQLGLAASGPLVMGLLYDLTGSYNGAWSFLFTGFVVSAALILFSRPPRRPAARA